MEFLNLWINRKNQWWRYLLTIVVSLLLSLFVVMVIAGIVGLFIAADYVASAPEMQNVSVDQIIESSKENIGTNTNLAISLAMFVLTLAAFLLCYKWFHKGRIKDLLTASSKFRYGHFFKAAGIYGILNILVFCVDLLIMGTEDLEFSFQPGPFFIGLALLVVLLPFQTLYEEITMRGYIQQGLAVKIKNKWVIILISSILFGLMHIVNAPIVEHGAWAISTYILMGICLSVCAILDNGLEVAWGIHFANNLLSFTVISYSDKDIPSHTLFSSASSSTFDVLSVCVFVVTIGIFLAIATKVFNWDWRSLNQKIETPVVNAAE